MAGYTYALVEEDDVTILDDIAHQIAHHLGLPVGDVIDDLFGFYEQWAGLWADTLATGGAPCPAA